MKLEKEIDLEALHTFQAEAKAAYLVRIQNPSDFHLARRIHTLIKGPRLVLGRGSNIIFRKHFTGLIFKIETRGKRILEPTPTHHIIEAEAGENWHYFVKWSLEQGIPGLENLAYIPGSVGASPVQNIGAYGLELSEFFHEADIFDLESGERRCVSKEECDFSYRDSIFKRPPSEHGLSQSVIIERVRLALPKHWEPKLSYRDIQVKMEESGILHPDAKDIFNWVVKIRMDKLPNPDLVGNAGSFFKNPMVSKEQLAVLLKEYPQIPHYPQADGSFKVAAAWMIDQCGWKGKRHKNAGVHDKQALVLINCAKNGESLESDDILELAEKIERDVYERFGVSLSKEPIVV